MKQYKIIFDSKIIKRGNIKNDIFKNLLNESYLTGNHKFEPELKRCIDKTVFIPKRVKI